MRIIENKKIFGKINIIDIIILLVVLIIGILVYKVIFKPETTAGIGAKYNLTNCIVRIEGVPADASKYLNLGSNVYDNETNTYIGKLKEFESGDYFVIRENHEENTFIEAKVPNKENIYLTLEVNVSDQEADLITENNYYIKVGKGVSLRTGNFAGSGYITKIDRGDK